jgi:hypothetical protein
MHRDQKTQPQFLPPLQPVLPLMPALLPASERLSRTAATQW